MAETSDATIKMISTDSSLTASASTVVSFMQTEGYAAADYVAVMTTTHAPPRYRCKHTGTVWADEACELCFRPVSAPPSSERTT